MTPRLAAILALLAAALTAGAVVLTAGPGGGPEIQAAFSSAVGLMPGNDVRIDGAPAGSVTGMELTDRGTALVTMRLNDGLEPPRADATAAIRPVDLIGDNYVALEPGRAPAPQVGPIPTARTLDAPRLNDLLDALGDPQLAGLKAMLVESGLALDSRGADLNQAALALRPALGAADRVVGELSSQNADLRDFVGNAERVAGEAASRNRDLGDLVDSLDATLQQTQDQAGSLGLAIDQAPATLGQVRETASKLTGTARAALPLAESLRGSAPALSQATATADSFLSSASRTPTGLDPVLRRATTLLTRGEPTFRALGDGLSKLAAVSPTLDRFLQVLGPAAPSISRGFFVNFPDQAAEPGKQPFDPFADPRRHYWRGAAVLTCQSFGVPIRPGCLEDFLKQSGGGKGKGAGSSSHEASPSPGALSPASPRPLAPRIPHPHLPGAPDLPRVPHPPRTPSASGHAVQNLLDFIFGP